MPDSVRWKEDFPVPSAEDSYATRREFTKFLGLTSVAFLAGTCAAVARKLWEQVTAKATTAVAVASLDEIPAGGSKLFRYPTENDACILLRRGERELLAYSQKCTHLSCAVVPDHKNNCLHCPCHEGVFDLRSDRVLAGPPPRPLPRIALDIRGRDIFATGVESRTS